MSANRDLRSMTIAHAHDVERFEERELRVVRRLLTAADRSLKELILSEDITEWSRQRFIDLSKAAQELDKVYTDEYREHMSSSMRGLGEVEADFLHHSVESVAGDAARIAGLSVRAPTPAHLMGAVRNTPITMNNTTAVMLEPFLRTVDSGRRTAIEQSLQYSFAMGDSPQEAVRRLIGTPAQRGALNWTKNRAYAVTRTALNHMSTTARRETYESNEDLVKGYQWVSTLDQITSDICQYRDGRVWLYDPEEHEAHSGAKLSEETYPPAHPNCRSTTIPLLRSWRELGIDEDELEPGMRASMDGTVPATQTYHEWFTEQSDARQKEVLGATRFAMYKAGEISITKFHGPDGRMLTLEQLRERGYAIPELAKLRPESESLYANPRELASQDETEGFMRREGFVDDVESLSEAEHVAWRSYVAGGYRNMNSFLRHGETQSGQTSGAAYDDAQRKAADMSSGIGKASTLDEPMVVWRGLGMPEGMDVSPGSVLTDQGFLSTAGYSQKSLLFMWAGMAKGQTGARFRIEVPKGTSFIAGVLQEGEFVFPPGSRVRVTGSRSVEDVHGKVYHEVSARMEPYGGE